MLNLLQYFHSTIICSPPLPPQWVGSPQRQWSVQGGFIQGANLTVTVAVTIFEDRKQPMRPRKMHSAQINHHKSHQMNPFVGYSWVWGSAREWDLERAESGAVFRLISQSRTFLIRPITRPSRPARLDPLSAAPRTHKIHFTINLSGQLSSSSSPHVASRLLTVLSKMSVL